jgi:hypothetical protein
MDADRLSAVEAFSTRERPTNDGDVEIKRNALLAVRAVRGRFREGDGMFLAVKG